MAAEQLPNRTVKSNTSLIAIALIAVFAIAAFLFTRPDTSLQTLSPVSGLIALKSTAQAAMPYDVAMTNQKPTLIEFYADWCTTCQAMAPTFDSIHRQMSDQVNFVMLDIDDPQWLPQVQQFQVNGVPYLALLDTDKTLTETFIGKVPKQVLLNKIANLST